jgi:hypothetical protein
MSKHAELLRRADKEQDICRSFGPITTNGNGKHDHSDPMTISRDEVMKLVKRLFLLPGPNKAPRTLIFSAADVSNGSGSICARTGATLASCVAGCVCVVDADLDSPSLHRHFGIEEDGCGLQEMVAQSGRVHNFARQLPGQNLWLVTCGTRNLDSHTLLSSDAMRSRLAELRAAFDYVLIQAPPVSLDGASILLGPLADGIILVIEANSTRRAVARKAKEDLALANVQLLGAILNNRTFPIPEAFYRHL